MTGQAECRIEPRIVITCEHGGNSVPPAYRKVFSRHKKVLETHRGYDPGALALAKEIAGELQCDLFYSTTTRLLIELNRSPGHPNLYSFITKPLAVEEKREIRTLHYDPYRSRVEAHLCGLALDGCPVIHLSIHSFTPELDGEVRNADIGILYDPRRGPELQFALRWQDCLRETAPQWTVRRNYPYRGTADGFTTHLRKVLAADQYIGIELEVNQKHVLIETRRWKDHRRKIIQSIVKTIKQVQT